MWSFKTQLQSQGNETYAIHQNKLISFKRKKVNGKMSVKSERRMSERRASALVGFDKSLLKSFFAYFTIVDTDNSGILEQDEIEGNQ